MAMNEPRTLCLSCSDAAYAAGPLDDQEREKTLVRSSLCFFATSSMTASTNSSVLNFILATGFVLVGQTICWSAAHFTAMGWAARYWSIRVLVDPFHKRVKICTAIPAGHDHNKSVASGRGLGVLFRADQHVVFVVVIAGFQLLRRNIRHVS